MESRAQEAPREVSHLRLFGWHLLLPPLTLSAPRCHLPLGLGFAGGLADRLHGRVLQLPLDGDRVVARMGAVERA